MFAHIKINNLNDFFMERDSRPNRGVYFTELVDIQRQLGSLYSSIMRRQDFQVWLLRAESPIQMRRILHIMRKLWAWDFG